jgi:hypothetical protein
MSATVGCHVGSGPGQRGPAGPAVSGTKVGPGWPGQRRPETRRSWLRRAQTRRRGLGCRRKTRTEHGEERGWAHSNGETTPRRMAAVSRAAVAGGERYELAGGEPFGWCSGKSLRRANGRGKTLGGVYGLRRAQRAAARDPMVAGTTPATRYAAARSGISGIGGYGSNPMAGKEGEEAEAHRDLQMCECGLGGGSRRRIGAAIAGVREEEARSCSSL